MAAPSVSRETRFRGRNPVSRPSAPPLILLALLLLGFWLRVHNLDAFSFWTDEGLTPARSGYPLAQILRNEIVIQGVVTTDTHPPLYYLIIALTRRLFGLSDFAFRYPSVLFGVLLIPLLYQLARHLPFPNWLPLPVGEGWGEGLVPSPPGRGLGRGSLSLGLVVAVLTAVNPLQVYYSQEARMYTLLALLATGMSYVLWRAIWTTDDRRRTTADELRVTSDELRVQSAPPLATGSHCSSSVVRGLLLYAVLAALTVYTHYTAAFLVAAQALLWGWLLWRVGRRQLIIGALLVGALAAIPLVPYTLPRLMSGAEANYFPVSPLTVLSDVVRFFHLGLTVDFGLLAVRALNWVALGLLLVGVWAAWNPLPNPLPKGEGAWNPLPSPLPEGEGARTRPPAWLGPAFLLSWLLAVPVGLIAGSALFKPMYQGVRHIMAASPAFLLLMGYGLVGVKRLWTAAGLSHRSAYAADASRMAALLLPALVLAGAAASLLNLYFNPAFVKDDFRAIVRFIETRAGGNDVVVYNNAVLLPLHEHYRLRPDVAVTALPAYPQMATGQEPELAALAEQYSRVWFVTDPPADGRDDDALIHAWLDANLREVSDRLFPARTTEARVVGYATTDNGPPTTGSGASADTLAVVCGLSSVIPQPNGEPILDCARIDRTPLALPTLWVDLWWGGEQPPDGAQLVFTLTGPDGAEHYRRAHPLRREGAAWDTAAPNALSYDLPLPPGLPPGPYTLAVGLEGQEAVALGEIEIASTDQWPAPPEALFAEGELAVVRGRPAAVWPNGLALAAVVPWDERVIAGNNLPLTLFWRVGPAGLDLGALRYRLEVIDRAGAALRSQETRPGATWLGDVPGGALLREVTSLYFRPETPPGRYRLRWTLLDGETVVGRPVVAGEIVVEAQP